MLANKVISNSNKNSKHLYASDYVPRTLKSALHMLTHLTLTKNSLRNRSYFYLHFTDEENETYPNRFFLEQKMENVRI